ncbi:hypothetical protein Taro_024478 [Colocasia esculenta]|uniref:Pentatricopeptide repeat-containing protein n=1 Tax=Colocasia esculenta TaxID=4460 RepID=A0A843V0F9_COLES|nr:hypothetical protein [Colocasia esculenta]
MVDSGVWPVDITFVSLVKIFDEPCKIKQAKQVHGCMVKLGIKADVLLGSALITMYSKCGGIDEIVRLFARMNKKDMVSWTSLLAGYVQNGLYLEAIKVSREMIEHKVLIDSFVIASLLCAFTMYKQLRFGKEIHAYALRNSSGLDVSVSNALITLYGKCGEIRKAEIMFQAMEKRDSICWTAMLTCYGQNDYGEKAVFLFCQMMKEGLRPHLFSFTGAIRACAALASIAMGEQIHSQSIKVGIFNELSVENSLITMYGRCGNIDAALEVFNWILVSCSHAGLVAEGHQYFKSMSTLYGLEPKMEHYACPFFLTVETETLNATLNIALLLPSPPSVLLPHLLEVAQWPPHPSLMSQIYSKEGCCFIDLPCSRIPSSRLKISVQDVENIFKLAKKGLLPL